MKRGSSTLGLESLRQRRRSAYGAGPLDRALDVCRRLAGYGLAVHDRLHGRPRRPSARRSPTYTWTHSSGWPREGIDAHVSVKLSALDFDADLFAELDAAAARTSRPLHVDALAPETVDATWLLLQSAPRAGAGRHDASRAMDGAASTTPRSRSGSAFASGS